MAEALFERKLLDGYPHLADLVEISSCGTDAIEGNPATSTAVQALDLWDIDLEPHRASSLTPAMLREADLVLALARDHLLSINRIEPEALRKSTTLKYLANTSEEILDILGDETVSGEKEARSRIKKILDVVRRSAPEEDFSAEITARGSDIIDPIGGSLQVYLGVAEEIDSSLDKVMMALFGRSGGVDRAEGNT